MNGIPWWLLLALPARSLLTVLFVLVTGLIQGRTTGTYPSVEQWCAALATVQRFQLPGRAGGATAGRRRRSNGGAHRRGAGQNGQS